MNGDLQARSSSARDESPVRRYHSHTPGLFYLGFTLLLAVGAVNSQNNLLFLALGLTIGGLLISGVLSGASLMGVRLERHVPGRAAVGSPVRIRYIVRNSNRIASAFGLHIVETAAGGGNARRRVPWPRFMPQPRTFVVHVPPSAVAEAEVMLLPRARGRIELQAVQVWSTFPFGLTKKSVTFKSARTVLVFPPDLPLRPGMLRRLSTRSQRGTGAEDLPGPGEEFFGLREYMAGDSPRQIAWKRTARTGEVIVRQNAAPSPPRLWVLVNFASDGAPAGRVQALEERSIALAASILRSATDDEMAVGLAIPCARILHPPREGRAHLDRLLTELALLEPAAWRGSAAAVPQALLRGGPCIVVHAGAIDRNFGPPGAQHVGAAQAESLLESDDASVGAVLAMLDGVGQEGRRHGRLRRGALAARRLVLKGGGA